MPTAQAGTSRLLASRDVPAWAVGMITHGTGTARLDGRHPA